MTREIDAATAAAAQAPLVRICVLVAMDFSTGWVRLWSGLGPLTWNGMTFEGAAILMAMNSIKETTEGLPPGKPEDWIYIDDKPLSDAKWAGLVTWSFLAGKGCPPDGHPSRTVGEDQSDYDGPVLDRVDPAVE